MSTSFDLPEPDLFTTGTVGPPGQRVFYLQARGNGVVFSLRCEKQQVAALAEYLSGMLEDLPPVDPADVPGDVGLVEPVVPEWVVASLAVAWDEADDCVVLVAEEFVDEDADEAIAVADHDLDLDQSPATARLRITRPQATAFVERARDLVAGGRPPCRICGRPLDPEGHVCPRTNGHRTRSR